MSIPLPKKAMVLAAGLGKRLRPYTDNTPKPLLQVGGKPLIDWGLDQLEQADIDHVMVNVFYRAGQLQEHVKKRILPQCSVMVEEELLGTGGAILKALPYFDNQPFFVLHSNIIWINRGTSVFNRLAAYWNDKTMDVLVLIADKTKLDWYKGKGDFFIDDTDFRLTCATTAQEALAVNCGIYLIHPRIFNSFSDGAFPFRMVLEEAQKKGRLYGLQHHDDWYAVDTVVDYNTINRILAK